MKNICKKIGKVFGIMSAFLFSIWNKVLALSPADIKDDYVITLYGVPKEDQIIYKIFSIGKILLIPFILLLGLFIYYKKKDKEKYAKKIIIIKRLLIILSVILIIIGGLYVTYLIYNM